MKTVIMTKGATEAQGRLATISTYAQVEAW